MRTMCTWIGLSLCLMACGGESFEDCPDGQLKDNDGECVDVDGADGEGENGDGDGDGEGDNPGDPPDPDGDPLDASCDELGGNFLENDACVVTCSYDNDEPNDDRYGDCPGEVPCITGWNVCAKNECETDADCMEGWSCFKGQFSACLMPCQFEIEPCPGGWTCGGPDDWLIYGDDAYACLWDGYGA